MSSMLYMSAWGKRLGKALMKGIQKKKDAPQKQRWNIVRGDTVKVIQGPLLGQQGKVLAVLRHNSRVIIENVNMQKRIKRSENRTMPSKYVMRPASIHYSNVSLLDPVSGEPAKIVRKFLEDGTKVRVSKKSGHIIPKPDFKQFVQPPVTSLGPKDTQPEDTLAVTFDEYEKYLPFIYGGKLDLGAVQSK